jgi:DNA-binding transcriptional MerR regulator
MDGGALYSIGELARHTGVTVKTIRFYSDRGIMVPAQRTPAGHRRYGPDAVTRLALVRTLRELGLGIHSIRRVVDRELTLGDVAAEHAAALDVQIGILRLRRAVLAAAARREPTPTRPDVVAVARDLAGAAVAGGTTPESPQADAVIAALTGYWALALGRPDDTELRRWLLRRLEAANDPRRDRYVRLLAVINGWPAPDRLAPVIDWSVTALRARAA